MAANKSQGSYFGLFLTGLTILCAGIFYLRSGMGLLLLAVGVVMVLASLMGFMKIKPLEGKTALKDNPTGMKLAGAFVAALGWVLTVVGINVASGTSGRMVVALLGIAVTLFGIIYILPAAFNKNAVWK